MGVVLVSEGDQIEPVGRFGDRDFLLRVPLSACGGCVLLYPTLGFVFCAVSLADFSGDTAQGGQQCI